MGEGERGAGPCGQAPRRFYATCFLLILGADGKRLGPADFGNRDRRERLT